MLAQVAKRCSFVFALAIAACADPYSPRSYRYVDTAVSYAIVCHAGRRTLRIPEQEWRVHQEHGDYRGPCRAIGIVKSKQRKSADHTNTNYRGREARSRQSEQEWELILAARLQQRQTDSLESLRETEPTIPQR